MKNTLLNLERNYFLLITLIITSVSYGQDQYDSNGNIIWNATANSGYNNNIDLIGRDDNLSLNKKQNTDVGPTPFVVIGLGNIAASNAANPNTFSADRNYLVWGDNNSDMNDSNSDVTLSFGGTSGISTSVDLPNRRWKIVESGGDVGKIKVSIPSSGMAGMPALSGNDAYVMIIASDAGFTSNVETVFLTANGTNLEADFDFDGTKYFTFGITHQTNSSRHASFDGMDELIKFEAVNNLASAFTMMFWVRPTGQNALINDRTIASKYDGTSGYRVYLSTDNKLNVSWTGGTTMTSSTVLPSSIWHNIAIVYSSGSTKLYIDGVLDSTVASSAPTANTNTFSIGAEFRNKSDIRNYFAGDIDEFRLWDKNLSLTNIKFIINQEILQSGTGIKGAIIPETITKNDIQTLKWANLVAYYSMNSFIGTHVDDDSANNNRGNLFNLNKVTVANQTAPMPYNTVIEGQWSNSSTWLNGSIQAIPNGVSIVNNTTPINWNIVRTSHNVFSTTNKMLLGLLVSNNTLTANNDTKIEISHYLKLDGKIDLAGKSQLVQPINSDLDVTSSGTIERDQQGQSNIYNYNYWSSPVSSINSSTINHGFTVADVMKDGTTSTPQNITWSAGIDGAPTSPITLASYWIFNFQELGDGFANWGAVGQNGALLTGQGFTLKGSGTAAAKQNYTFVGKPNNGTITSTVSSGNLNLCGNPYPSAIDANKFIDDNAASITGTLYFWEHYSTNTSHNTIQYQGGYATYTKTGGTAPVAPSGVSGLGTSAKKPKRFIPVGQGFFVTGSPAGGTITYKNSQRRFVKEENTASYTLFRTNNSNVENSDSDDEIEEEQFTKLSLGFDSANNYHRQILLGFMNENATAGFDIGYDGLSIESLTNDMYFINEGTRLNIQGDSYFNVNNIYPLGVKNAVTGNVKFSVDNKEFMDENQDIYIYDSVTDEYHNIKSESFEINLPAGTNDTRFSLRFNDASALGTNQNELQNGISVVHSQSDEMIVIKNELQEVNIDSVVLFNLMGQTVNTWTLDNQNQNDIQLSVNNFTSGAYIVKVNTDKGSTSKKFIIK
ncbi:LamG-like jellyroll fold domain-containing protein [Flavobacterium sp.]|uniref:LamG-like jellyroll fold domain-containing protein n=1 Tax=Flavobacterium sp. TaxID=239 RepID=UPI00391CD3EC